MHPAEEPRFYALAMTLAAARAADRGGAARDALLDASIRAIVDARVAACDANDAELVATLLASANARAAACEAVKAAAQARKAAEIALKAHIDAVTKLDIPLTANSAPSSGTRRRKRKEYALREQSHLFVQLSRLSNPKSYCLH
jgi:hypothetical protein